MNRYPFIYFVVQLIPALAIASSLSQLSLPLDAPHCRVFVVAALSTLLLSDATSCFSLFLCIFCSSPRINCFSKETWLIWGGKNFVRNDHLCSKCADLDVDISRTSQPTEQGNRCGYKNPFYAHAYKCFM